MKYDLKDIKGNYKKEHEYQQLYRSVDFFKRKPMMSANWYHWYTHSGFFVHGHYHGCVGHMERYALENPGHSIYWLEPESEWYERLYETGYDERYTSY